MTRVGKAKKGGRNRKKDKAERKKDQKGDAEETTELADEETENWMHLKNWTERLKMRKPRTI